MELMMNIVLETFAYFGSRNIDFGVYSLRKEPEADVSFISLVAFTSNMAYIQSRTGEKTR